MKTAPPTRTRRFSFSRPHPGAAANTHAATGGGGAPGEGSHSGAPPPEEHTPAAAVARHTAEAAGTGTTPPAPARATFVRSFVYAWNGVVYTVRTQRNMRIHIALAVFAIALGIWLRIAPVEFAMVFVAITGVVVSEMINTVAEACVDLVTQEFHPLARVAKDVAAGAVLLSAILAVIVACFVYIPYLWPLALRLLGH
ncbi:MAG TPA: diacylglycerol kinase family protein [Ktedonobacterales bacterium]|nr:diacylglycerol kinase family protein [Ktedonobacterales bacterium]